MTPQRFGDYTLLDRLGHGGMGEIFLAKPCGHAGLERLVAIKRIHGRVARNSRALAQFTDEANIAARMGHSNIAQIFDFGEVDGRCYIAMEHIHGRDLSAIFRAYQKMGRNIGQLTGQLASQKRASAMPMGHACYVVMKLCEALDYAHKRRDFCGRPLGFVHRDVSLRNLMLSFDGELKLIDFGIAKAVCRIAATEQSAVRGTPAYMSPEQVQRQSIDHRSDVFACGIALFELLTGQRLFYCRDIPELIRRITKAEIPAPRECNPAIPEELEAIMFKALERDPDDRYQSALELFDALLGFVQGAGLYITRAQVAEWMKTVFRAEYRAETERIASLWAQSAAAPEPCQGHHQDLHGAESGQAGSRVRDRVPRGDRRPTLGILVDEALSDGRVQHLMSPRDTERGWAPAGAEQAVLEDTGHTRSLRVDRTRSAALARAIRRDDDRGDGQPDGHHEQDGFQPTSSSVITSARRERKPITRTENVVGTRSARSRQRRWQLGSTVLVALSRWISTTSVILTALS